MESDDALPPPLDASFTTGGVPRLLKLHVRFLETRRLMMSHLLCQTHRQREMSVGFICLAMFN